MLNTEEFLSLLSCQRDLLNRLLSLAKEEHTCLVNNEPDRLSTIVQDQTRLLAAQAKLSKHITTAMRCLVGEEHNSADALTLTSVAKYLDEQTAETVRSFSAELIDMSEDLQRQGRINYLLSQQSLRYIDFTMRLISKDKEGPIPYQPLPQANANKSVQILMDTSA